jgi:hypothetical protein
MAAEIDKRLFNIERELRKIMAELRGEAKAEKSTAEERLRRYENLLKTSRRHLSSIDVTSMLRKERDKKAIP